jgi:hypothetical protein
MWINLRKKILTCIEKKDLEGIIVVISREKECDRKKSHYNLVEDVLCECCKAILDEYQEVDITFPSEELEIFPLPLNSPVIDHSVGTLIKKSLQGHYYVNDTYYRVSNPFLNYAITSVIIEKVIPREICLMGIYECNNQTVIVRKPECSCVVDEEDIDIMHTLRSLIKMIYNLKKHSFSHGLPDYSFIKISNNILTIDPCHLSSITYNQLKNFHSYARINMFDFQSPQFNASYCIFDDNETCKTVKIPIFNLNDTLSFLVKNFGFPLYASAIDMYFFLCSLRTFSSYRKFMEEDEKFTKLWKSIWVVGDACKVSRELFLLEEKDKHSYEDLYPIISSYPLRTDITEFLYKSFVL